MARAAFLVRRQPRLAEAPAAVAPVAVAPVAVAVPPAVTGIEHADARAGDISRRAVAAAMRMVVAPVAASIDRSADADTDADARVGGRCGGGERADCDGAGER